MDDLKGKKKEKNYTEVKKKDLRMSQESKEMWE